MTALSVIMSGRLAGTATAEGWAASTRVGFVYDPEYLKWPDATPLSVSVPLREGRHEIGVWLDGLVPDNSAVRDRWQVEHKTPTTSAIDLLASPVGRDCAGAVQFCGEADIDEMLRRGGGMRPLSQRRVARMIERLREDEAAWSQGEPDAAFSLGGAQAKTALRYDRGRWWLPYDDSPTTHILKPGVGRFSDSDLIEHLSQRAAVLLGIDAAETECVRVQGNHALLVTRYDRIVAQDGEYRRVHQEDMCQALAVSTARKYQKDGGPGVGETAGLLWTTSSDPEADVRLFRDALIYNWVIAGTDAHAKNYGLLLHEGSVRLAPLYDICSALPYRNLINPGRNLSVGQLKLAMKLGRDYTIHKADYRPAWERTSRALALPADETFDRAEQLSTGIADAVEEAIEEMPQQLRSSEHVRLLYKEVKQRARHCRFLRHMSSPSQYAKLTPGNDSGPSFRKTRAEVLTADRPVARKRCTHIGERSNKRCVKPPGHKPPHRYK